MPDKTTTPADVAERLTCAGIGALAVFGAPMLFFGLGGFLNWLLN